MWICESIGSLKGVGQQEKAKMNELSIHRVSYIQIHVHHHGIPKMPIQSFGKIYDISLRDLPGKPPPSFKYHRKAKNTYLSRYGQRWVEKLKSSTAM